MQILTLLSILFAYVIGSFSSAIILAKALSLPDPRSEGSGNAGATNMLRIASKKVAALVVVGDVLKGVIAVLLAKTLGVTGSALGYCALASVVGHIFPCFFGFKGGKGVATFLGALLGLSFTLGLTVALAWVIMLVCLRYSSFASIFASIIAPILTLMQHLNFYFLPIAMITVIIIYKHKGNIQRLLDGSEPKVKF